MATILIKSESSNVSNEKKAIRKDQSDSEKIFMTEVSVNYSLYSCITTPRASTNE